VDPWGRPYETDAESRMVVFWVLLPVIVAIAVGIWKAVT
jgi:hypothetical protein